MRKMILTILILLLTLLLGACGSGSEAGGSEQPASPQAQDSGMNEEGDNPVLIIYFTRPANTNFGTEVDTDSSASIQIVEGQIKGNTQLIAEVIHERVGGDVLSVSTQNTYPADYNEALDYAMDEQNRDYRPVLTGNVTNLDEYGTVFLGFPLWWYDLPMAMYSFFEENDFSGKTVIPFNTSGGSGFSDTIATLEEMLPDSRILEGFTVRDDRASESEEDVLEWLDRLGF